MIDACQKLEHWLTNVQVSPAIFELRPDYCAGLMVISDIRNGPPGSASDRLLKAAEQHARRVSDDAPDVSHKQVEAWRECFRSFGAKPNRTRPSVDALLRRASNGLPRINRVTDIYNSVSITFGVPIGVEDVSAYRGPMRLVRADGGEQFQTTRNGEDHIELAEAGEPIWRDDAGVTCRRWNWRQTSRTALEENTQSAVFIVDTLGESALDLANDVLDRLQTEVDSPGCCVRRTITRESSQ